MRPHRFAQSALLATLLVAAFATSTAHATQWKWRDADGRVQYSDRPPPPGVQDKDILTRPPAVVRAANKAAADAAASAASASGSAKPAAKASDPELEAKKRKADEEKDALKKAEEAKQAKARAQECERARGYQKALDDGIRIGRTNAKGEREILDDAARAQETARNRQAIDNNCK
jgi:hypothetical protein